MTKKDMHGFLCGIVDSEGTSKMVPPAGKSHYSPYSVYIESIAKLQGAVGILSQYFKTQKFASVFGCFMLC